MTTFGEEVKSRDLKPGGMYLLNPTWIIILERVKPPVRSRTDSRYRYHLMVTFNRGQNWSILRDQDLGGCSIICLLEPSRDQG